MGTWTRLSQRNRCYPGRSQSSGMVQKAANQGHTGAQSALSQLYFSGRGVPRDYIRAYTWASIAAGLSGNQNEELKEMASVMTELQLRAAQRRISNWWTRAEQRAENRRNQ